MKTNLRRRRKKQIIGQSKPGIKYYRGDIMAKRKPLTVVSWQEIKDPVTGEITAVRLEDLTPEQAEYYRNLRNQRLIEACNRILQENPKLAAAVLK